MIAKGICCQLARLLFVRLTFFVSVPEIYLIEMPSALNQINSSAASSSTYLQFQAKYEFASIEGVAHCVGSPNRLTTEWTENTEKTSS
jgi:hypothetical protein